MRRGKTIAGLAMLLALVALVATGCGGDDGGGGGGSGSGKARLTYAVWNEEQLPALREIARAFEAQNPNIKVDVQLTPFDQYFTKLQTSASAGNAPDVFWLNAPNFGLYASEGQLKEMTVDKAAYPQTLIDLYSYEGKLYGVPKDIDTIGLWYNKRLFDAAKVDYPDASWTWDDLRAAARKLTDPKRRVWGIAAAQKDQEGYYNTIPQAGGYVISPDGEQSGYDKPETIQGLAFWTDLIRSGSSPTARQMVDTEFNDLFASQKVAMIFGGSWRAIEFSQNGALKGHLGVAPLPKGPQRQTSVIHGLANVVYAKTEHPEQATKFAEFLGGPKAAEIMARTGTVIPALKGRQALWQHAYPDLELGALVEQIPGGVPLPVSQNTAAWKDDETEILAQVWAGRLDPAAGARKLDAAVERELSGEQG